MTNDKIQTIEQLATITKDLKKKNKKVVLCHGVFDLMHPGHIMYFKAAKKRGDVLVVTVTPDQFIKKGPGRPVFNEGLRLETLSSLECVDYVGLNEWPSAENTILRIKPNFYVKGQDYADAKKDLTGKIKIEMSAVKKVGGKTIFTNEPTFSSSALINDHFSHHPLPTSQYLQKFKRQHSAEDIIDILKSYKNLKVLVIGESILDEYFYCHPLAKSPKETIVASKFLSSERFAGGALAIANHLAGFCGQVSLVTTMGVEKGIKEFFNSKLLKNVKFIPFLESDRPTITKRRYAEPNFLTKMFEVQFFDDQPLRERMEKKIIEKLRDLLPKHDMVVVADYGHGLLTEKIRNEISSLSNFLAVNTQTNSANFGFNVATKYRNVDFVSIDEPELKLALRTKYGDVNQMAANLRKLIQSKTLLVSRGPNGSVVTNSIDKQFNTPIFSVKVVDRTGAGDSLFALTAPSVFKGVPEDIVGFIGSCAGAIAVETVCNREPIDFVSFTKFITSLLK